MNSFKEKVYQASIAQVKEKIKLLTEERKAINEGILEDTKSSAGDKFETGREMMSRDLMTITTQIKQATADLEELYRLQAVKNRTERVQEGSLVNLGDALYLISISFGALQVGDKRLFLLSKNAPLGELLLGKKQNDQVEFRGKLFLVKEIA
ncbi:hypothetical protein PBT90_15545 [Algoriphagus halophytocola]|uniref:3-oxoacyl-ACP synthase n=1 Tax=Algoriphagus halophytocola TaxID=2991499 RepID=A0ABY6MBM6_9BACT|nr:MULTISPECIES: hypothetical protein [unclassified Algoriphagus]UZD20987.1 hypothetical protein OM944_09880 [Algoriphagus sp. TR-M5]WBL42153.1 hypothetical protein PBT90_15545 [Algoriphagus sp. TR-M9]